METNIGLCANVCQVLATNMEIKFVETLAMSWKKGSFFQSAALVKAEMVSSVMVCTLFELIISWIDFQIS